MKQTSSLEELITRQIKEILDREVQSDPDAELKNEGMDSISMIKLIANLEAELDFQIDDEDLLVENFSTIRKIADLLSGRYGIVPARSIGSPAVICQGDDQ